LEALTLAEKKLISYLEFKFESSAGFMEALSKLKPFEFLIPEK
jgi:hypothetical protein